MSGTRSAPYLVCDWKDWLGWTPSCTFQRWCMCAAISLSRSKKSWRRCNGEMSRHRLWRLYNCWRIGWYYSREKMYNAGQGRRSGDRAPGRTSILILIRWRSKKWMLYVVVREAGSGEVDYRTARGHRLDYLNRASRLLDAHIRCHECFSPSVCLFQCANGVHAGLYA